MRAVDSRERRGGFAAVSMKNTDQSGSKEVTDESSPPVGGGGISSFGGISSKDKFVADCSGSKNIGNMDLSFPIMASQIISDVPTDLVGTSVSLAQGNPPGTLSLVAGIALPPIISSPISMGVT